MLESDVVIGRGSFIGERTHITQSVIGSACKIGNDVDIINAYLWDNVVVKVVKFPIYFHMDNLLFL